MTGDGMEAFMRAVEDATQEYDKYVIFLYQWDFITMFIAFYFELSCCIIYIYIYIYILHYIIDQSIVM
jgi:phage gp36-like protein